MRGGERNLCVCICSRKIVLLVLITAINVEEINSFAQFNVSSMRMTRMIILSAKLGSFFLSLSLSRSLSLALCLSRSLSLSLARSLSLSLHITDRVLYLNYTSQDTLRTISQANRRYCSGCCPWENRFLFATPH